MKTSRLSSLDALRGLTIAGMILVKILNGKALTLKTYIYNHLLVPWAGHLNGSLAYSLFLILFWIGIMIPLHRRKIFIRI